jgi:hypothetical protein
VIGAGEKPGLRPPRPLEPTPIRVSAADPALLRAKSPGRGDCWSTGPAEDCVAGRGCGALPRNLRLMLIRISDPTLVPALVGDLEQRPHYVVKQVGGDRIAVGVLGSFADGGALELRLFLAAWQAAHPAATFDLLEY